MTWRSFPTLKATSTLSPCASVYRTRTIITRILPKAGERRGGFYANGTHNPMLIYFIELKQMLLFGPRDLRPFPGSPQ